MSGFAPNTSYLYRMDYRLIATGQTGGLFQYTVTTDQDGNANVSNQATLGEGTFQVNANMGGFSSDFVTIDC